MQAGHTDRLQMAWWFGGFSEDNWDSVPVLCPTVSAEAKLKIDGERRDLMGGLDSLIEFNPYRHDWYHAKCVFLEKDRCALHHTGMKPIEGRLALCTTKQPKLFEPDDLHLSVARLWDTDLGAAAVKQWEKNRAATT